MKINGDSVRGWIAIGLVAIGGVSASTYSYHAGQANVLVMESQIVTIKLDIVALENNTIILTEKVTRLKTLHEQRGGRRRR